MNRIACALLLCIASTSASAQSFVLQDKDSVVFYGDSITALRLYTRFTEDFVLTRYPQMQVRFANAGVPGDTVYGGYAGAVPARIARDVTPFHPTMITIMLGMNDGGYVPYSEKIDSAYRTGYQTLLAALQSAVPAASFTLIRPTPYDEITHGTEFPGYSSVVARNAETTAALAEQLRTTLPSRVYTADFQQLLVDALHRAVQESPPLASLLIPDRIHPAESAEWIMAAALVSTWHIDPTVSSVAIAGGKLASAQRATVTAIAATPGDLQWTQLDEALPLPLALNEPMTQLLLNISHIADIDRQMLTVQGLSTGNYALSIDDKPVAKFTAAALAEGVNLALVSAAPCSVGSGAL
jgi:lysophospholipase L1-like esterase